MSDSCPIHAFPWPICPLVEGASPFGNPQQQACIFQFNEVASRLAIRNICRATLMVFAGANLITGLQLRQQNLLPGICRQARGFMIRAFVDRQRDTRRTVIRCPIIADAKVDHANIMVIEENNRQPESCHERINDHQTSDAFEVAGVARHQRQVLNQRTGGDDGVG